MPPKKQIQLQVYTIHHSLDTIAYGTASRSCSVIYGKLQLWDIARQCTTYSKTYKYSQLYVCVQVEIGTEKGWNEFLSQNGLGGK